ncbi:NAD(P)/FAD-dependent oxidoreductase, partial [Xanthomonas translucens]
MNARAEPLRVDVAVIGAGAAGLMCALTAGRRGRRVRVIEHANKVGKKILMSGGGRCNFTNTGTGPGNFLSSNPHFCKSALARYRPADFVEMVERHAIAYHEKELGQLFCDISSKQIVRMLVDECEAAGVSIQTQCGVRGVERGSEGFRIDSDDGPLHATSLVVASGGLSIPSLGASGFGYELARQFGHAVLPTRAGLVPLTLSGKHQERLQDLSGLALPVEASCNGASFRNFMLITHRGISGPAILQISSYWQPGDDLRLDLLPGQNAAAWLREQKRLRGASELRTVLGEALPRR